MRTGDILSFSPSIPAFLATEIAVEVSEPMRVVGENQRLGEHSREPSCSGRQLAVCNGLFFQFHEPQINFINSLNVLGQDRLVSVFNDCKFVMVML